MPHDWQRRLYGYACEAVFAIYGMLFGLGLYQIGRYLWTWFHT